MACFLSFLWFVCRKNNEIVNVGWVEGGRGNSQPDITHPETQHSQPAKDLSSPGHILGLLGFGVVDSSFGNYLATPQPNPP
jgi:hypothetical protein